MIQEPKQFTAYSFFDALQEIAPYLKEGIEFDFITNQGFPQQIGTIFTFTLQPVVVVEQGNDQSKNESNELSEQNEQETKEAKVKKTRRATVNEQQ